MSNLTINSYTAAVSIDPAADYFLMQQNSSGTYRRINRNVLLGITGTPVDTSTIQTLSNKTLDNTTTLTIKDTSFTIQDDVDTTKQARFQLSGITTATTRTYTLPNASSTLVDLISTQTLTNKILTSPTITGGSISNAAISVDSISGFTSPNTLSVAGLSITSGVITTSGYASSTALQANAVQANQLATNAITLGYTQVTANITTTSTSSVQAGGLSTTVTIPSGGRRVRITAYCPFVSNSGGNTDHITIWDGTVGSGTQLVDAITQVAVNGTGYNMVGSAVVTPAAGSKTYNVGIYTSGGTLTITAAATSPAYILVEAI